MNSLDLQGRVAVITGAARGIGKATAARLLSSGASVALWDADGTALSKAHGELSAHHGKRVTPSVVDVTDRSTISAAHTDALQHHGGIDILINSAGILGPAPARWTIPKMRFVG